MFDCFSDFGTIQKDPCCAGTYFDSEFLKFTACDLGFADPALYEFHSESFDKEYRRDKYRKNLKSLALQRKKDLNSAKKHGSKERVAMRKQKDEDMNSESAIGGFARNSSDEMYRRYRAFCDNVDTEASTQKALALLEDFFLLYFALKDCTSMTQFMSIMTIWLKSKCKVDSVKTLFEIAFGVDTQEKVMALLLAPFISKKFATEGLSEDSFSEFSSESNSEEKKHIFLRFKDALGALSSSTKDVRSSPLFNQISALISTVLALGFLSDTRTLRVSVKGMDLFRFNAAKGHKSCADLIEVCIETLKFLVEKGYTCFTEGNANAFFMCVDDGLKFDQDYVRITSQQGYVSEQDWVPSPWLDQSDYEQDLLNCIENCEIILKSAPKGDRYLVSRRLETLKKCLVDFTQTYKCKSGLRPAPFSFVVKGTSSIGKSTIVNNLITFALQTCAKKEGKENYIVNPDVICTLNEMDKYHSDYQGHTQAVLLDDLGNANPDTIDVNPTVNIINFNNNIKRTAILAEAELKGKRSLQPRVLAATTNVDMENLSRHFSLEPLSVLRRFNVHIEATVRPDWCKPGTTFIDGLKLKTAAEEGNLFPDAWTFNVFEYIGQTKSKDNKKHQPFIKRYLKDCKGKMLKGVGVPELLELFRDYIPDFIESQKSVVSSSKKVYCQTLCPHGVFKSTCRCCQAASLESSDSLKQKLVAKEEQIDQLRESFPSPVSLKTSESTASLRGTKTISELRELKRRKEKKVLNLIKESRDKRSSSLTSESMSSESLSETYEDIKSAISRLSFVPNFDILGYLPKFLLRSRVMNYLVTYRTVKENRRMFQWMNLFGLAVYSATSIYMPEMSLSVVSTIISANMFMFSLRKQQLWDRLNACHDTIPRLINSINENQKRVGKVVVYFAAGVLALYSAYRAMCGLLKLGRPTSQSDSVLNEDLTEIAENVWRPVPMAPLPSGVKSGHSYNDISHCVKNQLASVISLDSVRGRKASFNGLFVDSNMMLIPYHERPMNKVTFCIKMIGGNSVTGKDFNVNLTAADCIPVGTMGETDVGLVYVGSSGDMRDLVKFFPTGHSDHLTTTGMLWKGEDGNLMERKCQFQQRTTLTTKEGNRHTHGFYYRMTLPSFHGLCGAVHVSETKAKSFIAGFHLAGTSRVGSVSAGGALTQQEIRDAIELTQTLHPSHVKAANTGVYESEAYGIKYPIDERVSMKSPTRFMSVHKKQAQIDVFGTLPSSHFVNPKSSVIKSPISDAVAECCGVENQWGPPPNCRRKGQLNSQPLWAPYQVYLDGVSEATQEFSTEVMDRSINDYLNQIYRYAKTPRGKAALDQIELLDPVSVASGNKVKFIDAMKPNTSMGFPVNKPKRGFLVDLDPEEYPERECPRILDDVTMSIAEVARTYYAIGQRTFPIFKACTKDEPTKMSKAKTRVFQAAPVSLQYNLRRSCLPIWAFLSSSPIYSECAVGVNSQGCAWNELDCFLTSFGEDRIVAGDFKAYDQHMSARMVLISYYVVEQIAKLAGYSDEECKLIRGMATDVAYPVMSLNGELIKLYGSNPSGQNGTVYTNSIVNSIYQRCVFFTLYPEFKGNFQDAVHLLTYGDDNKMGISPDFPRYNHTEMQKVYATASIEYTMADKEAESIPLINHTEADFLKRKSRFEPKYTYVNNFGHRYKGMWLAMLEDDSIFKSLHSNLASSSDVSPTRVACQAIDTALREWWFHGREVFEFRRNQMIEVIGKAGLADVVPKSVYDSFDKKEADWMIKYGVEYVSDHEE